MKSRQRIVRLIHALSERIPLQNASFEELISKKVVPRHRLSWTYYLGGLTLFFLGIQIVTGFMLLFYYLPTVSDAAASIEFIDKYVSGGAVIRNLHSWSASFLIATVLAHMLTTFAVKAYEKPREVTWICGALLLLICFAFGFSGYVLPWNQVGVNATKVVFQSIEQVGDYLPGSMSKWPGEFRELIQGESTIGQATLSRMYALHVVVLPLLLLLALGLHLLLVQLHGVSQGVDKPTGRTERFFPYFILKDFTVWGIAFFVVFTLAMCLPFTSLSPYPLFEPYNAFGGTPAGIKPEWYFFPVYYPLEIFPFWLVTLVLTCLLLLLFLVPLVFRRTTRTRLKVIAAVAAVYLLTITLFGQKIKDLIKGG